MSTSDHFLQNSGNEVMHSISGVTNLHNKDIKHFWWGDWVMQRMGKYQSNFNVWVIS
jgi:hypothetical protein